MEKPEHHIFVCMSFRGLEPKGKCIRKNAPELLGYLESELADPIPRRGGKSKRIYTLTPEGLTELAKIRKVQKTAWESLAESYLP